jgi:hypothetical protein
MEAHIIDPAPVIDLVRRSLDMGSAEFKLEAWMAIGFIVMGFCHLMDANDEDKAGVGGLGGISGLADEYGLFDGGLCRITGLGGTGGHQRHCVLAGLGSIICF